MKLIVKFVFSFFLFPTSGSASLLMCQAVDRTLNPPSETTAARVPPFEIKKTGKAVYSYYLAKLRDGRKVVALTYLVVGSRHSSLLKETEERFGAQTIEAHAGGEIEISNGRVTRVNVTSSTLFNREIPSDPELIRSVFRRDLPELGLEGASEDPFIPYSEGSEHLHPLHFAAPKLGDDTSKGKETLGHYVKGRYSGALAAMEYIPHAEYILEPSRVNPRIKDVYSESKVIMQFLKLAESADGVDISFWGPLEKLVTKVAENDATLTAVEYSQLERGFRSLSLLTKMRLHEYDSSLSETELNLQRRFIIISQ